MLFMFQNVSKLEVTYDAHCDIVRGSMQQNILTEISHQQNAESQKYKLKCITILKFLHLMERNSCHKHFDAMNPFHTTSALY